MHYGHLEDLCGVIRIFKEPNVYGDKYEWAATYRMVDLTTIEFLGVVAAPNLEQVKAIEKVCTDRGITSCVWTRSKNGKKRTISFDRNKKVTKTLAQEILETILPNKDKILAEDMKTVKSIFLSKKEIFIDIPITDSEVLKSVTNGLLSAFVLELEKNGFHVDYLGIEECRSMRISLV